MKRILQNRHRIGRIVLLSLAIIFSGGQLAAQDAVVREVLPAVVRITGYLRAAPSAKFGKFAERSGFIFDEKGLIFTVYDPFVAPETRRLCEKFEVTLADGQVQSAEMLSVDVVLNLAILRILEPGRYPAVDISREGEARAADEVFALAGKAADGAPVRFSGRIRAESKSGIYEDGFADMLINSVMTLPDYAYGGPLVNRFGEVVGMNLKYTHTGGPASGAEEEHAVPLSAITPVYEVLLTYPTFEQNWLGFNVRRLSVDERQLIKRVSQRQGGVSVDYVWPGSPAAAADIRPGDLLTALNGQPIVTTTHLKWQLYKLAENSTANVTIVRSGQTLSKPVRVEKRPRWAAP